MTKQIHQVYRLTIDNGDTEDATDFTHLTDAKAAYLAAEKQVKSRKLFSARLTHLTMDGPTVKLNYCEDDGDDRDALTKRPR